jgi:hypothetical protein
VTVIRLKVQSASLRPSQHISLQCRCEILTDRVETRLFGGDDVLMLNIALGLSNEGAQA